MRKILLTIIIFVMAVFLLMMHMFLQPNVNVEKQHQYSCKLIEKEYNILLDPGEIISYKCSYSRDYACAIAFRLTDSHNLKLKEMILKDEDWIKAKTNDDIVNTYIAYFISFDEILSDMKKLCDNDDTYVKVIVWENNEYVNRFSIMAVNIQQGMLYYFTWN